MTFIAIVDDSKSNRAIWMELAMHVEPSACVEAFPDAVAALARIESMTPDLVITDFQMPEMDGAEFIRRIRTLPDCEDVPIIVVSVFENRSFRYEALEAGATDFLMSPVDHYEFKTRAKNLLTLRRQQFLLKERAITLEDELRTETARYANAMRQSHEHMIAVLDTLPTIVYAADKDGNCQFVNRSCAKLFDIHLEDVTGHHLLELFGPDKGRFELEKDQTFFASGRESEGFEEKITFPDGSSRDFYTTKTSLYDPVTKEQRVLTAAQDITERMEAEQEREFLRTQLLQSQKIESLGTLAGGIAHEFNNLLMVIGGYVSRAIRHKDDKELALDCLQEAERATKRASSVTKQLLVFGRRQVHEQRIVRVRDQLIDVQKMLTPVIGEGIELNLELAEEDAAVIVDSDQLSQAVVNLLLNGRDSMPNGGWLTIGSKIVDFEEEALTSIGTVIDPGRYVAISVEDHGSGMDDDTMQRMFDPFFSTKGPTAGTGLGLAVVYGFVQDSRGFIDVESTLGEGTRFTLYFPWYEPVAEIAALKNGKIRTGNGEVILVVEDEDALRELLVAELSGLSYEVISAEGGVEAIEIEEDFDRPIDLLLSDVVMPGLDGPDTARVLQVSQPEMKTIFMSGYAAQDGADTSRIPEDASFISKPVDLEDLAQKIHETLSGVSHNVQTQEQEALAREIEG